ncbi:hypothetical protein FM038_022245 [Shewanella eurypsychrophilus]|uniref:Uncharacterized protein n=1 Tax=Shewanella eurypsychrophilus TaxID=2593656 RepID=A0ABX6VAT8_9GAMM|nr:MULTISPECIES: hypothetical protein [Shewanella]QFU24588.1 hypothetical protein FS418_23920 [Shewanella sp. YLB-09]QPG59785.1 hypothetical protein FM038_022245 [Shewanella eurypsychrophilus]
MAKQIIHLLLFIALVGQNLLSPAMATSEFLHSVSHEVATQPSAFQLAGIDQQTASLGADIATSPVSPQDQRVQGDLSCIILASGHCVTHCAAMTGIVIQSSLDLMQSTSSEMMPNRFWSVQTAESVQVYRPPIA